MSHVQVGVASLLSSTGVVSYALLSVSIPVAMETDFHAVWKENAAALSCVVVILSNCCIILAMSLKNGPSTTGDLHALMVGMLSILVLF